MTEAKKGNIFIIAEMILWSLFPIVSILGFKGISPLVSLFWVNIFATFFFLILMLARRKWTELKIKKVWKYELIIVFFIGIIFYGLLFYALSKTTPANAAIILLFEIVPSYIFFQIIKKEHFALKHIVGVLLAVVGALIVLLPKSGSPNPGDLLILLAVFAPPVGNWYQQKARKIASTETILFLRHLLTTPFLFILIYALGESVQISNMKGIIGWMLVNGIFIFGLSKVLWVEGIHRMTVTRALAIGSLNPIFTMIFAWIIMTKAPTLVQLASLPFLVIAVWLLTNMQFKKNSVKVEV